MKKGKVFAVFVSETAFFFIPKEIKSQLKDLYKQYISYHIKTTSYED